VTIWIVEILYLFQALQEISVEDRKRQLDNCRTELTNIDSRRDVVTTNLKDAEKKLSELMKKQRSANGELDKWRTQEKEAQEALEEDARSLDKMATKQNMLQKKIDECTSKICDLGSLPSDFFDKYQNMSTKNVSLVVGYFEDSSLSLQFLAALQRNGKSQPTPEKVQPRQQEGPGSVHEFLRAEGKTQQEK
jgi:septation ring formation regulator EzrA